MCIRDRPDAKQYARTAPRDVLRIIEPAKDAEGDQVAKRLILWVYIGSCLVQNDNRRIFQHSAGDGNPLAFPAGKMGTGAADNRIIALIQLADKGVAAALFGCCLLYTSRCV